MKIVGKKEPILLLLGDLCLFTLSLWLALALRNFAWPSGMLFLTHLRPFALLFVVWVIVFYIAGLYGKHTVILRSKLPSILLNTGIANALIAIVFFYFIPFFGITPKTVLFIYLVISFVLILIWRMQVYFLIGRKTPESAYLLGSGQEAEELRREINANDIYNIRFVSDIHEASIIVVDLADPRVAPLLPDMYRSMFEGVSFVDMHKIYEDIFDRVPISLIGYDWFIKNISTAPQVAYDTLKRLMDIVISLPLLVISLIVYPFVALAIKMDDGGPIFISQERVGQGGKIIHITKFRSMERNDIDLGSASHSENKVTRVGKFLRDTRIDELPQLWSVLKGEQSLIGPRPELPSGVAIYNEEIPYYNVRHTIKPGLSGWAQIYHENHPHHGKAVTQTKEKLAYDLYYIKNRSLLLDLQIALRTIKTLLSRVGK
jgi:lipopolysaccharide/colanic/teichoic acid biosynthesis glycosyltransferase